MSEPLIDPDHEQRPWYKQFWPWFLITLPAVVVVAGIATLVIAIKNQDSLVADDYYKQGLAINRVLEEDDMAQHLQLAAEIDVDLLVGEIRVSLHGQTVNWPNTLELKWVHPTSSDKDTALSLTRISDGHYRGELPRALAGRWYVELDGDKPQPWRLRAEINLNDGHHFVL